MPDLSNLILLHDSGTGDMGSLDYLVGTDVNDAARWPVECVRASISSLRVHYDPAGTAGLADLVIRLYSHLGEAYDMTLHTIENCGVGADVNFRVPKDQQDHYYVCQGDQIVLTWTNPGTARWGAELALVPCDRIAIADRGNPNAS